MKKLLFTLLMLAPLGAFAQKYAHFNMADILPNMAEYQTASNELQTLATQYQEELDRLQKEYQTKTEEYQKLAEDESTAQAILQSKMQDIQKMEQSIQDFYQASQQDIQKQQSDKYDAIQAQILTAVNKIAEAGGYVYVMDLASASVGSPVVFVNTSVSTDITAQVKTALGIQ